MLLTKVKLEFLQFVIETIGSLDEYELIVGVGPTDLRLTHGPNVHLIRNAPQVQILKRAALMITHCGGNSIKECIEFNVPMLCYPCENDQFGNAARVINKGLGLIINPSNTSDDLQGMISELTLNPKYRNNLRLALEYSKAIESQLDVDQIIRAILENKSSWRKVS